MRRYWRGAAWSGLIKTSASRPDRNSSPSSADGSGGQGDRGLDNEAGATTAPRVNTPEPTTVPGSGTTARARQHAAGTGLAFVQFPEARFHLVPLGGDVGEARVAALDDLEAGLASGLGKVRDLRPVAHAGTGNPGHHAVTGAQPRIRNVAFPLQRADVPRLLGKQGSLPVPGGEVSLVIRRLLTNPGDALLEDDDLIVGR